MGISCDPLQQQWWDKLNALRRFHAEHAHRRVLTGGRYHGVVLSRFIAKLRKAREAGRFTQQHIAAADELGMSWQIAGRRDQPGRPRRAAAATNTASQLPASRTDRAVSRHGSSRPPNATATAAAVGP